MPQKETPKFLGDLKIRVFRTDKVGIPEVQLTRRRTLPLRGRQSRGVFRVPAALFSGNSCCTRRI